MMTLNKCPTCGRVYKHKKTLIRHLRYECQQEPKFCCNYCSYRAYQNIHVKHHMIKLHPEKCEEMFGERAMYFKPYKYKHIALK